MQIFFSHSSKIKPLVREVIRILPRFLDTWIDEKRLLTSDRISATIEQTIKSDTDYVVLFVEENAIKSEWVIKEIKWALEAEKKYNRQILFLAIVDQKAYKKLKKLDFDIDDHKFITLENQEEASVRNFANALAEEIFAHACRELDNLRNPKTRPFTRVIEDAKLAYYDISKQINKALFEHRKENPITVHDFLEKIHLDEAEHTSIMNDLQRYNLLAGYFYDGNILYLIEEHSLWKKSLNHEKKANVARKAAELIHNGMKVFLDAGSTTGEIASILCNKIESHMLKKITLATTSIDIGYMFSTTNVHIGSDDNSEIKLYVPGGRVRPSTQAIVPFGKTANDIIQLGNYVKTFDLGILGTNGVDADKGFTTHAISEVLNKKAIIEVSKKCVIVRDSSKIGLKLEGKFATFKDNIEFYVDNDKNNKKLLELLRLYKDLIILVD